MVRPRRDRVPLTLRDRLERVLAVASEHGQAGGVHVLGVAHDDDRPALSTQRLADCRCEPEIRSRRIA